MDERLVITGQNINDVIPPICGYNTGQHSKNFKPDPTRNLLTRQRFSVFVDVSESSGPISLAVLSNLVERKRFRLRICQISECTSQENCLQYYTGVTGTISSFNYDQLAAQNRSRPSYFVSDLSTNERNKL